MKTIDLSGIWQLALDPSDSGLATNGQNVSFNQSIPLPGSLPEHHIGDAPRVDSPWIGLIRRISEEEWLKPKYVPYRQDENFKMPFWLQPDTVYVGAAWYQREVDIPESWAGQHLSLVLERPHWETRVWVDNTEVSQQDSLSVPHVHDLSGVLTPGTHTLTIRVDNRMIVDVGQNAHSMSDHTQGNWNGIVGRIKLVSSAPARITSAQVFTDIHTKTARVEVQTTGLEGENTLSWTVVGPGIDPHQGEQSVSDGQAFDFEVELGEHAQLWDEFSPNLYTLTLTLGGEDHSVRFGLRAFRQKGKQFAINGRNVLLRGTLECCAFPLTGYPPTDHSDWRKIFTACLDHGLNHVRFHSWCPPEAAFDVADEMGMYLQVECSSWANQDSSLGDGRTVDTWLYEEGKRIVAAYGNHPSFVMMAYGNEPGGDHHKDYLTDWVTYWKAHDPRRVHTSAAGWPELEVNEFQNIPQPRVQRWGEGLKSRINGTAPDTLGDYRAYVDERNVPVVSHEIGQWCVYPNFEEMQKYTGVMKPRNFEIFQDFLTAAGLRDQAEDFLMASGKLQVLAYKEDIEASLRTDGFGGFQLLGLYDFPGQGTALVGVLDAFWEAKPYVQASEFKQFCAPVVPLARLPKRVFTSGESLEAGLEIAHYGPADLKDAVVVWEVVTDQGDLVDPTLQGTLQKDIPCGSLNQLGDITVPLDMVTDPTPMTLRIRIDGTDILNTWDLWVFPETTELPGDSRIVRTLDEAAVKRLDQGETLWLMAEPGTVNTDIALGFSPIFWNTAWTGKQPPHTLGILCDPEHAALAGFPTESHSNWQWWSVVSKAAACELPPEVRPIIQVVPDWFDPKCLGLAFEVKVGPGRLLVTSIDLKAGGPVGSQLYRSLLRYLDSESFAPDTAMSADQVRALFS